MASQEMSEQRLHARQARMDGPAYHADYYNCFVIQPMLVDVLTAVGHCYPDWEGCGMEARQAACRAIGTNDLAGRNLHCGWVADHRLLRPSA
jgi:hypothetical protein